MPFQVEQLIEGKGMPVYVTKGDPVSKALSLMIEFDFSQLPVISEKESFLIPEGMITYECILRGIRNFKAKIDDLKVRDVMVNAPIYSLEDDLFDILDRLKNTNAVLIISGFGSDLVGIVTSYDTTEYFRNRTEDLMRVEDIELMVKDFIKTAYTSDAGELDEVKLQTAITHVTNYASPSKPSGGKKKGFDDLTLSEYINLLCLPDTWSFFEPIFNIERGFVIQLLHGIREIRNGLAHFRGNISAEQRDQLKFGMDWLTRCQDEYQSWKQEQLVQRAMSAQNQSSLVGEENKQGEVIVGDFQVTDSSSSGSRYAALADWLQSQPGRIDQVQLTFNQIEEIINTDLPASARNHRAWWSNDSVGHSHSQLWLEAGWRTTYINLSEGKISFSRIREREKAHIAFFSQLLNDLRKKSKIELRNISPDGTSWIVVLSIPGGGYFSYSFSRDKKLRAEVYLDLGDQNRTKAVFDLLKAQKVDFDAKVGDLEWERLDSKRASRIALYHEGQITDKKNHRELRAWAVDAMAKLIDTFQKPIEEAFKQVTA